MKNIGIIVSDGIGIRNYLYSNIITELLNNNVRVILYHNLSKEAIKEVETIHNNSFDKVLLPRYSETIVQKFYRELICLSRLKHNVKITKNVTTLDNWRPNTSKLKNKIFYKVISLLSVYYSKSYRRILKIEKKYDRALLESTKIYEDIIKKTNPSTILNTHQRSIQSIAFVRALRRNKVLTIGAIFSWDNLPKARISVKTDKYIVWSNYMKSEMKLYYPEILDSNVIVTGTPQFDFYYEKKHILSKEVFFETYDLDKNKKVICFSGNDLSSPYDELYLEQIINAINAIEESVRPQLILRRSPVELSGRFDLILKKYGHCIKEIAPLWNFDQEDLSNWLLVYPKFDDIKLLTNTVYHSDLVINIGSTVAHDFAIYKKPVIYVNYDLFNDGGWSVSRAYQLQHFKSIGDLEPVYWLNDKNKIAETISKALESKDDTKQIRDGQRWLNLISSERTNTSQNIANLLIQ